jgi:hypothetical protein
MTALNMNGIKAIFFSASFVLFLALLAAKRAQMKQL